MNLLSSVDIDGQQAMALVSLGQLNLDIVVLKLIAHQANYYLSSPESLDLNENDRLSQRYMSCYPLSASSSVTSFEDELCLIPSGQPTINWDIKFDPQCHWSHNYLNPPPEEPLLSQIPLYAPVPRAHDIFEPLRSPAKHHLPATQQHDAMQDKHLLTSTTADAPSFNTGPVRTLPRSRRASRDAGRPYPQQPSLLHPYDPESGAQMTFQTPSELLQDLNMRGSLPAQTQSQSHQETKHATQRKSLRSALAASVGFEPTDP